LGRAEGGLSAYSMGSAFFDWATHLALSPGRQMELAWKAVADSQKLVAWAAATLSGEHPGRPPIMPDRRFSSPEWAKFPFSVLSQGYLLSEQWWKHAVIGLPGVDAGHALAVELPGHEPAASGPDQGRGRREPDAGHAVLGRGSGQTVDECR
jgi:polyhydroxyalkanoate synthase